MSWRVWVALALAILVVGTLLFARLVEAALPGEESSGSESSRGKSSEDGGEPSWTPPHEGDALKDADVGPVEVEAPAEAVAVAENFVRAWSSYTDGESPEIWQKRVAAYAHPRLASLLQSVNPEPVQLNGELKATRSVNTRVDFIQALEQGQLLLYCTLKDGQWRVSSVDLGA